MTNCSHSIAPFRKTEKKAQQVLNHLPQWRFRLVSETKRPLIEGPVLFLVARGGSIRKAN